MSTIMSTAILSECRRYRYELVRSWATTIDIKTVVFICLNPSTANEHNDDMTVAKCIRFAKQWGFNQMVIVNLFAFRSTDPKKMLRTKDPIGIHNDRFIRNWVHDADMVVAAWGINGGDRGVKVASDYIGCLYVLGLTKNGHPRHPLYIRGDTKPREWFDPYRMNMSRKE